MREAKGNMLTMECDALCITTNGFVKGNGECVMGRGIAKQVADALPNVPGILGRKLRDSGNHVHWLTQYNGVDLVSFPVKSGTERCGIYHENVVRHMCNKFKVNDVVPGWACKARIDLIEQSCKELTEIANRTDWQTILVPRAGCGAGELSWEEVRLVMEKYLDNRFIVCTF